MNKGFTKLGYLMDLVKITGKELSEKINIDNTTISKWKNNQRKINPRSEYPRTLAKFFLEDEFELQRNQIINILSNYKAGINGESKEQLIETLSMWLVDNKSEIQEEEYSEKNYSYRALIDIFVGELGWNEAYEEFWKYTSNIIPGQDILIGDFGNVNWNENDKILINKAIKQIHNTLALGNKVRIIDRITGDYKPYQLMLKWLPIYLSEGVEIRYFEEKDSIFNKIGICCVKNQIALISKKISYSNEKYLSTIYKNKECVDYYCDLMDEVFKKSRKLIEIINYSDVFTILELLEGSLRTYQITYLLNNMPTFRNMPLSLLENILKENEVEDEKRKICIEAYKKGRELRNRCNYRQIYNLDSLEKNIDKDYIVDYDLSKIIGKEIRISNKNYRKQLEYIMKNTTTDNYQIALVSFSNEQLLKETTDMIVQEDSIVLAWDATKYERRMYCKELTIVGGFFEYMEEVWNNIPLVCRNDNWFRKQIKRILDKK